MFKILLVTGLLFASSSAFAAVQLNAVGGISYVTHSDATSSTYTNLSAGYKMFSAYGLLANIKSAARKDSGLGLSIGALYVQAGSQQDFRYFGAPISQYAKMPYIQMPVALNYWFGKSFSFGVGAYYALAYGSMENAGTYGGVQATYVKSFGENYYKSQDYGILAQMQFSAQLTNKINFLLTGYYEKGLLNLFNNSGTIFYNTIILGLAGLGYTF